MKLGFWIIMLSTTLLFAGTKKIVIDLTTGDMETFKSRFLAGVPASIKYFKDHGDEVETAVIVHGEAYKFFIERLENTQYGVDQSLSANQEAIHERLNEILAATPMHIEICRIGMNKKGILSEDLYPFSVPIQSSMVGLIKWQNEGYAYIPIH